MVVNRSWGRSGFTLVEMMIAMIITLMIVFAMVQAFRWVGETTTEGRAVIEMLGQMRSAAFRFEDDLSRTTLSGPLKPPCLDSLGNGGYIEIIEGPASDNNPFQCLVRVPNAVAAHQDRFEKSRLVANAITFADPGPDGVLGNADDPFRTLLGDPDDFVCGTFRNDNEPFRGRFAIGRGPDGVWNTSDDIINVIESNWAEIIWWAELNDQPEDLNGDGVISPWHEGMNATWDPGETFSIRRRVLLIRPDLNNAAGLIPGDGVTQQNAATVTPPGWPDPLQNPAGLPASPEDAIRDYLVLNDISVRLEFNDDRSLKGIAANSLGDLTLRCNRVAHQPMFFPPGGPNPPLGLSSNLMLSPLNVELLPAYTNTSLQGEDVVLNNVLAFDLRVWEPNAPVCGYQSFSAADNEIPEGIVPGDPGFVNAMTATPTSHNAIEHPNPGNVVGRGAYVDLGCLTGSPVLALCSRMGNQVDENGNGLPDTPMAPDLSEASLDPQFLGDIQPRSRQPAGVFVYDPWPMKYEGDGFDQDGSGVADQGAFLLDGLLNGDYDKEERETMPPYYYQLKSLQVRMRVYESDTRQVRQVSKTVDFGD